MQASLMNLYYDGTQYPIAIEKLLKLYDYENTEPKRRRAQVSCPSPSVPCLSAFRLGKENAFRAGWEIWQIAGPDGNRQALS